MNSKLKYNNCISLGWFCGTAASMNKYGLRGFSGPFDWMFSDFSSVIKQIEEGFQDFMIIENLEPEIDNPKAFVDKKYGFKCFHDVKMDIKQEYPEIKSRYDKRSVRFLELIKKPTCFFRAVRNENEVAFINNNSNYIREVITKYNKENEIIFLLPEGIMGKIQEFYSIELKRKYGYDSYSLRTMFDSSKELVDLVKDLLPQETITRNLEFDSADNSSVAAEVYKMVGGDDIRVMEAILKKLEATRLDGIYLWGAGHHGTALYKYLTGKGVKVSAVVDINANSLKTQDIPLILPSEVPDGVKIFIAIAGMKYCDEVAASLADKNCRIVTYKDLRKELGLC